MYLRDIKQGIRIRGLYTGEDVSVISTVPFDSGAMTVIYQKADGSLGQRLVYSADAEGMSNVSEQERFDFSADPEIFKLVAEAQRIKLAYLFDPYIAVNTSNVMPLPHQITAVYEKMLPMHPLRYVLADDPGAGKTIMTGLLLKELIIRADVKRALIVSPGNLVTQWQDELYQKFNLSFEIMTNEMIESARCGNVFLEHDMLIARLDKLARNDDIKNLIEATDWDIVVIDEAHKLSANVIGTKINYTKRFNLGRLLSKHTRHFLLLTATPHSGDEANFQMFMSLVDEDRFTGHGSRTETVDTSDVMRRLVKEDLLTFEGKPLFPERTATTVSYNLSFEEQTLYEEVSDYVREQFNRADRLKNNKRVAVGFALTVLQRRLASSPEAIYQSLKRRRERLENKLEEIKNNPEILMNSVSGYDIDDDYDDSDDFTDDELEGFENQFIDDATAARSIEELQTEIVALKAIEDKAFNLRNSGVDKKWDEVSKLLQSSEMKTRTEEREKIIIFTEHKDTLKYLEMRIKTLLGKQDAVMTIQGGMSRADRKFVEDSFRQNKDVSVLIATDAAGEGINLQRAHLMINYDLPWNPNRIEQRFGRIHRIGQKEICHLWNIVAKNTREGEVFSRLFAKLEIERQSLGGKVFDVLGKIAFDDKPLRDILIEAIRFGNEPKHRDYINTVVNTALDTEHLKKMIDERALSKDFLTPEKVYEVKEEMERMNARRLQPYYIKSFFRAAMDLAGGSYHPRENGRFEVKRVPNKVIEAYELVYNRSVLKAYERICFDRSEINIPGKPDADLIAPGHPLMDALISYVLKNHQKEADKGTVLVSDAIAEPRILCSLDYSVRDGVVINNKERIVSRQMCFVQIDRNGMTYQGGPAPYLDYSAPSETEIYGCRSILESEHWISTDFIETKAISFAVNTLIPRLYDETKTYRIRMVDKIESETKKRLKNEIFYWDNKASEYREAERKGSNKPNLKVNMVNAQNRADELERRMNSRLEHLSKERELSPMPPVLSTVALVVPKESIMADRFAEPDPPYDAVDRKAIEMAAMNAVMEIERKLGYIPRDVSKNNCGYDIESFIPVNLRGAEGYSLRCIEVKGKSIYHDDTVTITRNEILTALNIPKQYILAIIVVEGESTTATYCQNMFSKDVENAAESTNFNVAKLLAQSEIVYDER